MKDKRLIIHPPEGVPIQFMLATRGSRFGAQFLDVLLTYGGLLLLMLVWLQVLDLSFIATLFFLLVFLLRTPYYIFAELVWNGRTLGKKLTRIRVISADGTRLSPYQITARNLMKEIEVFLPIAMLLGDSALAGPERWALFGWMIAVLSVPLFNRRNQRLGDILAGTLVVEQPATLLLPDLASQAVSAKAGFRFSPQQLGIYGRFELQALEAILRDRPQTPQAQARIDAIARTIQRKTGYEGPVLVADHWDFLSDFYRQQRGFLESRHLMGDTRENKFHETTKNVARS
ncbi:RDD family protein [Phaeovulum sp. W22_SRMD_FR3]|uniref:RDD family protein n=1 Tax=Phaeovulum sp. W22_SRMD_FR3 TaxID=3240274 RepID=UPI003F98A489